MVKECQELEKELEESAIQTQEPYQPQGEDLQKLRKLRLRNALRRALRPILQHKDSLENRVHFAKVIRKYNQMIEPCIQSSEDKKNTYVLVKKERNKKTKVTKTIEKIYFTKQIGSRSAYGMAFMNVGKGLGRILRFSIKIMSDHFLNEVSLLKQMSSLAEKGISPNMPIMYNAFRCQSVTQKMQMEIKQNIQQPAPLTMYGRYYVVLNELANGDMHEFFKYQYTPKEYESVIFQMVLALRTFHKYTKCVHNDAHLGNFLYHKIAPGGYWHYQYVPPPPPPGFAKYPTQDIYVPNTGYLTILWDPGMARPINYPTGYIPTLDFRRPLGLIQGISSIQGYIDKHMRPVPVDVFTPFERVLNYINTYPTHDIFNYIADRKDKYFKHIIFDKNKLPPNAHIINKTSYIV